MRSLRQRLMAVGLALTIGGVTGCGSDGGDGGTNPGNPAIAISLSKTSLSAQQGGSDNLTATITRSGGFTGTVNVVTEGAPAGVTAAVSNVSTSSGTTTGTVTVSVAASVAPGTYNLTVRASGSGVADVTQAVSLTVTAAPSIGLSLSSAAVTVDQGASGTTTVTINRTNFTGNVTLALEGAPAGVTGTFAPNGTGGTTSTLTIQVGSGVAAPGPYNLTVRATGTGVTDATTPLQLTVAAPASFAIASVAPSPVLIGQNGTGTVTVTLTRTNFTGTINLSLENAPVGVTGTFTPNAVTGTTATLQLQVGAAVTTGDNTLTVRAQAQGQADRTATFTLRVTGTVQGSYTLTTTPTTQATVQQGGTANVTVNVNRIGGFAGSVALAVTGAPGGLTATLTPTSTTGATSTLALSASGSLAVGSSHVLTITGTTAGLANQTAQLTVNVTAASSGGNVTLNYSACDIEDRPIWVASQDGNGAWSRVVGTGDVYSFNVTSGKGGFAVVTSNSPTSYTTAIQYSSQAEMQGTLNLCQGAPPAGKSLSATVSNLSLGQFATVSLGGGSGAAVANGVAFNIAGVADGTFPLFGYARSALNAGAGDRLLIRRGINTAALANGASIGAPLDFTGSESMTPAAATMTITNFLAGESVTQGMFYQSGASCTGASLYFGAESSAATFTAYGVPTAAQVAGETHGLSVTAATGLTSFRSVLEYFTTLGARNITMPSNLPAFTPSVEAGPYKRLRFQFTLPSDLDAAATLTYSDVGSAKSVFIIASRAGYLGGFAVDLSMPDFSGLAGWDNAWAPAAPTAVDWTATGAGASLTNLCTPGRIATATRTGTS